mmetsp:Transcript_20659/g.24264  ORF Transcript_20659/g.24264 Transcript_20659/m.24264 type:complete len:85 (-) Transcript_20659:300-554(-)
MITITAFIFTFASCCYCCCLAAWLSAVKARNRNENVRGEPVIDPNLDPADRAAIEAALRDIDRAQAQDLRLQAAVNAGGAMNQS